MTAHDLDVSKLVSQAADEREEEFSIPLDISDIITICREYNKLGWQIQGQIENIVENGVEESIKSGFVKKESLPHIKYFLQQITKNAYFGDATEQAHDCIYLIQSYEDRFKNCNNLQLN